MECIDWRVIVDSNEKIIKNMIGYLLLNVVQHVGVSTLTRCDSGYMPLSLQSTTMKMLIVLF